MAEDRMALADALRKGPDGDKLADDFLRDAVQLFVRELMETEVSAQIGAERYERTSDRGTQRSGYRSRPWDTRVGTLDLQIPKLRQGSYFPSWLEPRRRSEQALVSVVAEACQFTDGNAPGLYDEDAPRKRVTNGRDSA